MLTGADLAVHQALGITAAMLERMQIRRVDDREARETLALNGRTGRLDGVLYPYIDPRHQRVVTYRLRRDQPDFERGKPRNKYLSSYGDKHHWYFAGVDAAVLTDTTIPVIAVEAEKSVLSVMCAADQLSRRVVAIGLGGCFGWRGRIGKVETPTGGHADEYGPLPDFDYLTWAARDVVLVFDSNASSNATVQAARRAFGGELTRRGARIRILDLVPEPGINGPDDFIGRHGAERFFALVDAAPDAPTFDVIFRLNQRHAVVREAGKTVVITEEHDPVLNRRVVTRSSFADFRNFYLCDTVRGGIDPATGVPKVTALGHFWLTHPDRRQYEGIVMTPGRDVPGYLNLWRGFAVEPQAGDWSRFHAHLFEVICASNHTLYEYVLAWMAAGVQHPDRPAEVALAMRGPRGVGKGIFARTYGELFGQHYLQIANPKHLTGNFNAHLRDAIVLFADEAFWAGDKAGESVLKMLITEPVLAIEGKGRDVVFARNLLHLIIASNHDWVVPAGMDERRFCVLDIDPTFQRDHAYFGAIVAELEAGGRAAMLHDLLAHDISGLNLRTAPDTEALRQQKVFSMLPAEKWLFDKLMAGTWQPEHDEWQTFVLKDALHQDYVECLQKIGIDRRSTETELGMFISRVFGAKVQTVRRWVDGKRRWGWTFPNLETCRLDFDQLTQSQHPWPDDESV